MYRPGRLRFRVQSTPGCQVRFACPQAGIKAEFLCRQYRAQRDWNGTAWQKDNRQPNSAVVTLGPAALRRVRLYRDETPRPRHPGEPLGRGKGVHRVPWRFVCLSCSASDRRQNPLQAMPAGPSTKTSNRKLEAILVLVIDLSPRPGKMTRGLDHGSGRFVCFPRRPSLCVIHVSCCVPFRGAMRPARAGR